MKNKAKYDKIAELAEWVNINRHEVARDGMNIIIAIGDDEKIIRMCLTGNALHLAILMKILKDGADEEWHKLNDGMES